MIQEEFVFNSIIEKLSGEYEDVSRGKMMSSPAITCKNKVFAFYHREEMIFRLGRDFDPQEFQIKKVKVLSPFKTKPPLLDWFHIAFSGPEKWEELARYALARMMNKEKPGIGLKFE